MSKYASSSNPAEVYRHLDKDCAAATFIMNCKNCGNVLISMKEEFDAASGHTDHTRKYAFFKCSCGKKIKKLAMDISPQGGGYLCKQAAVFRDVKTTYKGTRVINNVRFRLRVYMSGGRYVVYYVTPETIEEKLVKAKEG